MYRQPGSTMSAVEVVAAMYDGPIPADVMMEARAEDARYAAENPAPVRPSAIDERRMMVSYYAEKVRRLIAAKRSADAHGAQTANRNSDIGMWFRAWRNERRQLQKLLSNFHAAG